MRKIKYVPGKEALVALVKAGNERGYNRQLDVNAVNDWLKDDDKVFPVVFSMEHEHIAGELVEPHMRVMLVVNDSGDQAVIDMSMDAYLALPEAEVADKVDA